MLKTKDAGNVTYANDDEKRNNAHKPVRKTNVNKTEKGNVNALNTNRYGGGEHVNIKKKGKTLDIREKSDGGSVQKKENEKEKRKDLGHHQQK